MGRRGGCRWNRGFQEKRALNFEFNFARQIGGELDLDAIRFVGIGKRFEKEEICEFPCRTILALRSAFVGVFPMAFQHC